MLPIRRALLGAIAALPLLACTAFAAEIKVMSSGGFHSALDALAPEFEKATGHKVTKIYGASMGAVPTAVPNRLARGEAADMVIIAGEAIDKLIEEGRLQKGSRTDLVFSRIGVAVREGAPKPDISTPEAVKAMLLAPVAEVVVVFELSDVREAAGEAVEPRPSVSWLALWDIGDMTAVAGSSTAPPNGWLI